jgi:hypothetical protein
MTSNFGELQKFGKEQLEVASSMAASIAKGFQTIATETTSFSKKSMDSNSAYVEKLLGANSLDKAIQIQSEYAKSAYEDFVAQATKIGDLYANLAKQAFKPVESVFANMQAVVSPEVHAAPTPEIQAVVSPEIPAVVSPKPNVASAKSNVVSAKVAKPSAARAK